MLTGHNVECTRRLPVILWSVQRLKIIIWSVHSVYRSLYCVYPCLMVIIIMECTQTGHNMECRQCLLVILWSVDSVYWS